MIVFRGIIQNIKRNKLQVYFVDFGGSQEFGPKEVFELPSSMLKTQALSQLFGLSGMTDIKCREYFSSLVLNKKLTLTVESSDGKQYPLTRYLYLRTQFTIL